MPPNPGASFAVRAAIEARCPPAELPATKTTFGSAPYSGPCSRTQASTFFRSASGSGVPRAQPVVRADADPTAASEPVEERPRLAALLADAERPAVQVDERRPGARVRARPIHVEQVRAPRVAVGDVRDPLDSRVRHGERPEEDPERQSARSASGQPGARSAPRRPRRPSASPAAPRRRARRSPSTASPSPIQPTGFAMSPCAIASAVEAAST